MTPAQLQTIKAAVLADPALAQTEFDKLTKALDKIKAQFKIEV